MRSLIIIFFVLLGVCPSQAFSAQPTTDNQTEAADKLVSRFENLSKDPVRGKRRDLWLNLEGAFQELKSKNKGEIAAKAALYSAKTRQELAMRSFLDDDHREAVKQYASVVKDYPKSSSAPTALYQQSFILEYHLNQHEEAMKLLQRLIKNFPKSREAPGAKALLSEIRGDVPSGKKPGSGSSVILKSISWEGKQQKAVITLELDSPAGYEYEFVPPNSAKKTPGRIHLDIPNAFPADSVKPGIRIKDLAVTRIRTSHSGDGVRISLDCDGIQCYAVSSPSKKPQILQIEVSRKEDIKNGISVSSGKNKGSQKSPGSEQLMKQLGLTVQTIMLDPGHGGKDPGATGGGIVEKQFTLSMAKRIGALLKKEGFTVLYTRTGNDFISLQDRPDLANSKKADLFISIHVNANPGSTIRGLETYYLDEAQTPDAATVAARENTVSVQNISDLQVILTDLMLSSKLEESRHLAKCVHNGILKTLRSAKLAAPDNGSRSAPFYVLMGARMPAILIEFGYITNEADAGNLRSEKYLQRQAEGVVQGVLQYKKELARLAPK